MVEMMFENNLVSDIYEKNGVGTDNMTCIIIEFNKALLSPVA